MQGTFPSLRLFLGEKRLTYKDPDTGVETPLGADYNTQSGERMLSREFADVPQKSRL